MDDGSHLILSDRPEDRSLPLEIFRQPLKFVSQERVGHTFLAQGRRESVAGE